MHQLFQRLHFKIYHEMSTKISIIIVDDEQLAIEELKFLMKGFPKFEIINTTQNWDKAIELIDSQRPNLIFLDIDLGKKTGFELLENLQYMPEVVFTTAYNQYAVKAFDFNVLDYLLKPISAERLEKALLKVEDTLKNSFNKNSTNQSIPIQDKVFIKDGENCYFVTLEKIFLIESIGNYSRVYFEGQKPFLRKSLSLLEQKLPSNFFRANRHQIINLNHVKKVDLDVHNKLLIRIGHDEYPIEVSARQSVRFKELMSL